MGQTTWPKVSWYGKSTRSRANPTRLSSLKSKAKECNNFFKNIHSTMKTKIQRYSSDREPNQARSKTDPLDEPVRTASTFVHHYNGTQYCNTETTLSIFPFLQTNITSQMWPSGGKRGSHLWCGQVEVWDHLQPNEYKQQITSNSMNNTSSNLSKSRFTKFLFYTLIQSVLASHFTTRCQQLFSQH